MFSIKWHTSIWYLSTKPLPENCLVSVSSLLLWNSSLMADVQEPHIRNDLGKAVSAISAVK